MRIRPKQSFALILLAALTACGSGGDMPIQYADDYGTMTFSVQSERLVSRTNPYEAYDPAKHPTTMGVFGYHDHQLTDPIFNNTLVTYSATEKTWDYADKRQWDDYKGISKTFDFFAVMPNTEGTQLALSEESKPNPTTGSYAYTLSLPFSIPKDGTETGAKSAPLLYDVTQAPLICAHPEHKAGTNATGNEFTFERTIKLQFDQTLTGYKLLFMLDKKMGAIRQFRIKKVELSGELATSGIVCRTYTWDGSEWTTGERIWKNIHRENFDKAAPFEIAPITTSVSSNSNEGSNSTGGSNPAEGSNSTEVSNTSSSSDGLVVTSQGYSQWGSTFYTIPDSKFNPTITVTYDVELTTEDGSTVVTRKDVTSDITFNKANFDKLTAGGIALVNSIRILIQPRYLYVLGDDDAYSGHLLIE